MTDVEPVVTDFTSTGRTGRRNAMPDILGSSAGAGAADLSGKLAELSVVGDADGGGEGSSSSPPSSPEEEKAKAT
ncbi:cAMP-dependent protein kinase inhibitor beta isoform X1 [Myripristis murdjan]|uniref:cAMP-dependent protein kinase inhibitor beta isoform X1 n=1 Tax=Myripristis murdjan TaxID=586833 RepID=UPI001175CA7D|nr:cAMP-dependent protein kinase inhibitor beta-like isoform X1 [Myripristis murdjan]XP_029903326.1 cAMP-dependent protein kinase inhibitor beta-like isoform X1 [Myripristis murdjan]XP_029903327.1 cAMP-dependent protein kinase inhibitor beta-like isoform X1 [Myripristis murdjan]XP_029903328.1 cAMP-dependent protein kinase inhibitor beta-like isoform X1 [Myripristis murdjan]XP_029903330.1 cAMP-dependent protein kinase inhibitor beta-like isoform X1 [Myripristis murdjan]